MKPNIFVDGRVFDTEFQGTRTYIENIYSIIDKIGDFNIYLASENPQYTSSFFPRSNNICFIKYKSQSKLSRVLIEIPSLVAQYKIEAAHFQYIVPPVRNTIQVVTIHDILFKDFPAEFNLKYRWGKGTLFYFSAKRADLVTTVSDYSKRAIQRHFHIPENDIHVVPNGVSPSYFLSYEKKESKQVVLNKYGVSNFLLYVSRIEPRKNQLAVLEAYLDLKLYNKDKKLVFIGKKSIPVPQIDAILASLNSEIKKQIYFFENISNSDLMLFYKSADLFIYPSKAEGFGIPPLEAAALEVPTICSQSTAMADFAFFGENHINPDKETIKSAIEQNCFMDPQRLKDISDIIKERYSWDSSALKLNELIWSKIKSKVQN